MATEGDQPGARPALTMSFIRAKKVKGNTYLYEVENYRDPATGKHKQRIKQYLGRDPKEKDQGQKLGTTNQSCCCQVSPLSIGDEVLVMLTIDGEQQEIRGILTHGTTQVDACQYPKGKRIVHEIHRAIHDPPGCVSVKYELGEFVMVSTVPRAKVRKA